ncbi:MAG TPA: serine/threonine-protein kinase [Anaerolineae bacterium]|nr:serine/threonine-protein kinase [Anaerolineae bacterium]
MSTLDTRHIGSDQKAAGGSLAPGRVLQERYEIRGVLGMGGFSAVYQARDLRFPNVAKLCAIKEMVNHAPDPQLRAVALQNFEREANILATLNHPAVPKVYDYFSEDNRAYLVMEFIDGRDLEAVISEGAGFLPQDQILAWALQLCDVLSFLHGHSPPIIFRDMKPSNIMLDKHGQIRLIDFGIAKNFQPGQKGTMIGTEGYSPPEQYRGIADQRTDLYALGATLHHLLSRQNPQVEPPFSFHERPIPATNPGVDPEFAQIVMRALEYEPDRRYAAAEEMKRALLSLRPASKLAGPMVSLAGNSDLTPLWTFSCEDEIRSAPAYANEQIFVGAYDNNLYALEAKSGKFMWKYATDGGVATTPFVHEDRVVIGSQDRVLYCINAQTGRIQWTCPTGGRIFSSPCVHYNHVFFGADDAFLYAANFQTGRVAWKTQAESAIRSSPAVGDEQIFFGSNDGYIYSLDIRGVLKWRYRTKRPIVSSPSVRNGMVYIGSDDWNVYALDAQTGWVIWRYRTGKPVWSSPVISDQVLYVGSADGNVYALEPKSGREVWRHATEGQVTASPVVHNGALYIGSVDQHLYCLDIRTGNLRWRFRTGGPITSAPLIVEDVLYVTSTDRLVYALPI